jgi:hypothetical protein
MKRLLFVLIILFLGGGVYGQCPTGKIILLSQADVNAFASNWPNCEDLPSGLSIGLISATTDIDNLTPLSNLKSVGGSLDIFHNDALTSLSGFDNITSVGGTLDIRFNHALTNLSSLGNLTSVGSYLRIFDNDALTNLKGLEGVTSVGYLSIQLNAALTSLSGLDNLTSVSSVLVINSNAALTSLSGLDNLTSVSGSLFIQFNPSLNTCNQLYHLLDNVNDANPDYGQPVPDVGGSITIKNNLTNGDCNSVAEILASGPPDQSPAIPTMSEWSFFLLVLIVFTVGIVVVYNVKKCGSIGA